MQRKRQAAGQVQNNYFVQKREHDGGKELWWGHAALSKALTSADVDRLKVLVCYTTVPPAMKCWSRI